ncbi:LPXTG cell wall anchor domain-containing protein (plasmid) [Embleya sp. NBC_00888]|uniref:LPXTG cell wall anchor domain-containing protein n=1 Tax=Embleya sp. NBC_00888 TaxID=2975960 RepID=UPI002F9091D4|nr:LPXTG cell wall anchor domain-containing protein [Embleya sp. NBC_00888]
MSSPSKAMRWATALAVPLVLAAGTAPAFATGDTYTVNLHQKLPLTATSDGVERGECPNTIPADKDGWHFVLPTNGTDFVKLTVTFQPGGPQVITTFGPPSDKHAYVASPAGATLTSAVAQVKGGEVKWFNLSHACPAKPPTTPPTTKPPTTSPPTTAPPTSAVPSTSKPPVDGTKTPAPVTSSAGTGSPSSSASPTASDSVAPTTSKPATTGGGGKSLAQTGTVAVGGLLVTAAILVGGGILLRRRRGNHAA